MNNENQSPLITFSKEKWKLAKQKLQRFRENYPRLAKVMKIGGRVVAGGFLSLFLFCLLIYFGAFGRLPSN